MADENILKCFVKGVSHMELPRNIRRGDDYCIGFFIGIAVCLEAVVVDPVFIDLVLGFVRFVELGQFFFHISKSFRYKIDK